MKYSAAILFFTCLLMGGELQANRSNFSADTILVEVKGTDTDARFEPAAVKIKPGDVLRFAVREGLHTITAYHPDNRRPLRIPETAEPFDSGLLSEGDTWMLQITVPGVYDYFCLPHEKMGHAGRIISGSIDTMPNYPAKGMPDAVLEKLNYETRNLLTKQYN